MLSGSAYAGLWRLGLALWTRQVEVPFLFPALRRLSGTDGPWLALVGDVLYATVTATVAVLLVAGLFKPWARTRAALFLIGFCLVQAAFAGYAGTLLPELLSARNLWLFVAWFALFAALRTRP